MSAYRFSEVFLLCSRPGTPRRSPRHRKSRRLRIRTLPLFPLLQVLQSANLSGANLRGAALPSARLAWAQLHQASARRCIRCSLMAESIPRPRHLCPALLPALIGMEGGDALVVWIELLGRLSLRRLAE